MKTLNIPSSRPAALTPSPALGVLVLLGYILLIAYGSLYPLSGWRAPDEDLRSLLSAPWPRYISRSDILVNILVYIPVGGLAAWLLAHRQPGLLRIVSAIMVATLSGVLLSIGMETLQMYLPNRVASKLDVWVNGFGTLLGALLAATVARFTRPGTLLFNARQEWFLPGRVVEIGLATLGLWMMFQIGPLAFALDTGYVRQALPTLWQSIQESSQFNLPRAAAYALDTAAFGVLTALLVKPGRRWLALFSGFVAAVVLVKIFFMGRDFTAEMLAGPASGIVLLLLLIHLDRRLMAYAGTAALLAGFFAAEIATSGTAPAWAQIAQPMNWIPFRGQMHALTGLLDILAGIKPFLALGCMVSLVTRPYLRSQVMLLGTLLLGILVFGLEWAQQSIPGRHADITDVLLALAAWLLPWLWRGERHAVPASPAAAVPFGASRHSVWRWIAAAMLLLAATAAAGVWWFWQPIERGLSEVTKSRYPQPEELPAVTLPRFRDAHPRLPAPSASDIRRIVTENPEFFRFQRQRANGGQGDLWSVILMARAEPGSQDLGVLHKRLMDLEYTWRGHEQAKPIALAYDWLYEQWDDRQRAELREKVVEGCEYLIKLIRNDRLSPYNVYLYNSPFQALVAATLALYGDDARGEPAMRFTYDLWINRVLPVWRQIMGKNGGWHEGGEYIGIGIGQAVYQVPAMWRSATGEDLFATEPGIRGFLDFAIYRTRPDGTHFRWGDAGFFDKIISDLAPLAIEYRDAAAYSLRPPRAELAPTSWPWGPLSAPELNKPDVVSRLPLSRFFDGLGLLVARSDWTANATYVTFKAGDNYWSHSHLDQGAFTLYKGGELAIDSGAYGPNYGSDHHMNYTYQTIAHNTITVTDPGDTVPAPGKKGKEGRAIANDGGQRRIGSGWGVEPAPLDRKEWEAKRDTYHTGEIEKRLERDGLSIAVADVTPAYTNRASGSGDFSSRTRRVERFWRIFGYDRMDDVIVIFDQVKATNPEFRKRWLLHTIEQPDVTDNGFVAQISPDPQRPGHGGGRVEGHVLLPKNASIQRVGGKGFEFFVDGRNYDENGKLADIVRARNKDVEPGAWRIEVSPSTPAAEDAFLTVLLPTGAGRLPPHQVRLIEDGAGRPGCEIIGPNRTTRWWFEPGKNSVRIEVQGDGTTKTHTVAAPAPRPADDRSLLERLVRLFK